MQEVGSSSLPSPTGIKNNLIMRQKTYSILFPADENLHMALYIHFTI